MDAKELRIGDWIIIDDGFPERVTTVTFNIIHYFPERESMLKPIPLTPEIFDKIKELNGEDFSFEWTKELGLYWDVWDGIYLEHIQHVHQFQNFYYMAENKELIVEL